VLASVKRGLREPLLQFLVAGALLFAGYRVLHPQVSRPVDTTRIEVTADDLRQLEISWTAQWHRPPSADEMRGLVQARVREEILYREALALGLDQGDSIVKRRLAQKMEFLASDMSSLPEPSPADLRAWYAAHSQQFAEPGRVSFRHVYFSTDRRGPRARDDAARMAARLAGKPSDAQVVATIGDRFTFQDEYPDREPEQIAAIFGSSFAATVDKLPAGSWQGPVESGLGWHLVFVTSTTPGRVPPYEQVEAEVRSAWLDEQRTALRQAAFDAMKARYEIRLPEAPPIATDAPSAKAVP
jgi:peptidyl-prolyl cis-trans isomerase C